MQLLVCSLWNSFYILNQELQCPHLSGETHRTSCSLGMSLRGAHLWSPKHTLSFAVTGPQKNGGCLDQECTLPKRSLHRWRRGTDWFQNDSQGGPSLAGEQGSQNGPNSRSPFPPGLLCEENIDDCARGPHCLNGGQCVDKIGGYSCRCLPGFAGERCEGDINECLSNPCSSEGSLDCIQLTNDYLCVCRSAFTGEASPGGSFS